MDFSLRSAKQEEVTYFGEEAHHLIARFLAAQPCMYVFFRQVANLYREIDTSPPRL